VLEASDAKAQFDGLMDSGSYESFVKTI
jgi:hypothetical protein